MSDPNEEVTPHWKDEGLPPPPHLDPARVDLTRRILAPRRDRSLTVGAYALSIAAGVLGWIGLAILVVPNHGPGPRISSDALLWAFPTALFCLGAFEMGLISVIAYRWEPDGAAGRLVAWLALFHGAMLVLLCGGWFLWYVLH